MVQTLYPHAAGGALVHTGAGQRYFASDVTAGGWFRAPERLAADLAALGITSELVVPAPAVDPVSAAAGEAGADAAAPPGGSGRWSGLGAAAVAAVLAAAVVAAALRRAERGAPASAG